MGKQWKNNGDQDKFITKLIKQGKVNKHTSPQTLAKDYPGMFSAFSTNVIRNHLTALKRSQGLFLDADGEDDTEDNLENVEEGENYTPNSPKAEDICNDFSLDKISHNYPILCESFQDPDNLCQKVVIAILLPSGAVNVKMELNDDGTVAMVKFAWPRAMCNVEEMFVKQIADNQITVHHPMVMSLKSGIAKMQRRIDVAPETVIKVNLPFKVLTAVDTWTKWGLKRQDGTHAVLVQFKGYIKDHNKRLADSSISFDM